MTRIVLASSSPRRRELLAKVGIRFTIVEPPEDQAPPPGMCADLAVQLLARQKALAVALTQPVGTFVIGADTMVIGPRGPMGKPHTPERAREMLTQLRGCRHTVLTGICAIAAPEGAEALGVSRSAVRMRTFSDADLEAYVASGEPLDKAGGYAIQGGASDFIEAVGGRLDTVVGLDVALALRLLSEAGYPVPLPATPDVPLAPPRPVRRPLSTVRAPQRV
ncbi:MAG TPA: Maf family protein [Candidatus Dormibacteraeota bacterium]|jgi:septum formation protein|nr:Maf family protein [Candidatus Dormibacteraeota bacterium]